MAAAKSALKKRGAAKRPAKKPVMPNRAPAKRAIAKRTAPRSPTAKRATTKRPTPRRDAQTPSVPNGIGLVAQHLDFTSHDLGGARRFYTELLGFSRFQHDAGADYLNISIAKQVSIGFMPPMPGPPEQWRPPREPALYLIVEDVDRAYSALVGKGVVFDQPPTDMSWGDRVALLRDPEGRMVHIAQHLQKG